MRKSAAVAYAIVLIGVLCVAGWVAAAQSARSQTITGTIVCLYCYTQDQNDSGMHHDEGRDLWCAWACIRNTPQPAGILNSEGRVWELAGGVVGTNNENIAQYVSQTVSITGDVSMVDGMPTLTADADDLTVIE